jgi:DNA-damage-inducible protein J
MALSTLTARVDEKDKAAFDDFCSSVGLTSSAAINMYVKVVVRDRKIPFEIKQEDPFYSVNNQAHLMKSIQQLKDGRGTAHELIEEGDE